MSDASDRSIPATPRRREEARQQGRMPSAAPLAWVAMVATAVLLLPAWSGSAVPAACEFMRHSLVAAVRSRPGSSIEPDLLLPMQVILPTAAVVLAAAAAGILVRFLLDGSAWRLGRAAPDLRRIDPWAGIARICSLRTAAAILTNALCLAVLVAAAALAARPLAGLVASAAGLADAERWIGGVRGMLLPVVAAAAAVAAGQWGLARLRFERRIRMTPEEFKDEMKGLEADPKIRFRRK